MVHLRSKIFCVFMAASTTLIAPAMAQVVPPNANTTDPLAPFYIDVTGLDLSTKPPTRDPNNPNYPPAKELPDGQLPSVHAVGNFIIGPTHNAAPETIPDGAVPKGAVYSFTMNSANSVIYHTGVARDAPGNDPNAPTVPGDPSYLVMTSSHSGTWTRNVNVYVPDQYTGDKPAPFIVVGDGGLFDDLLFTTLDNMIHKGLLPPMVAITIENGGQDAQGSQRGVEYDTVSGTYAEFVEREVLPLVRRNVGVKLTKAARGRLALGISSSGIASFVMAWYHPEWYGRVVAFSPTFVNQQWPHNPALRGGGWELHSPFAGPKGPLENTSNFGVPAPSTIPDGSPLVLTSATKPIRFWFNVGDKDLFYPRQTMGDGMHDWVLAGENMAKVLAAKGYQYQFVFARNAGHADAATMRQTLPQALQWVWSGYNPALKDREDSED